MFKFYINRVRDRCDVTGAYNSAIIVLSMVSSFVFAVIMLVGFYLSIGLLSLIERMATGNILQTASTLLYTGGVATITLASIWFCLLFINLKNHDYRAHTRGLVPTIELEDAEDGDE